MVAILQSDSEESSEITASERNDLLTAGPVPRPITYKGQDFDINGLVRRLTSGDIVIPSFGHNDSEIVSAAFQRSFVWKRKQMDRFIESILLGFPIPGIFLVRQQSDKRSLVLDGQQRLRTLRFFVEGVFAKKEFVLDNVTEEIKGLTYKKLPEELRRIFDDTFIQATIVDSDGSKESLESVYQIFERLNSGGTQLTPHEIRCALYAGALVDFLATLNSVNSWRECYGKASPRMRDQELILRIIAFDVDRSSYKRPLKQFLNNFVGKYREMTDLDEADIRKRFEGAVTLIEKSSGRDAFRLNGRNVNSALVEAVVYGLMNRLKNKKAPSVEAVASAIKALKNDRKVRPAFERSTADEEPVKVRLDASAKRFMEL